MTTIRRSRARRPPRSRPRTARPTSSRRSRRTRSRSRPTIRPSRPTSRTTTRPTARASSPRSPTRSPRSSGFTEDQVEWVVEPFNRSYAPGPKDYDFDINQISITAKRAEAVDFSSPYYEAKQAVVALKDSPIADATSLADVADADIGAQIGTTSLDAIETVIQPSSPPQVFDTSNDVVSALKNGQVEAVVVDVPTAFFLTAVQVTDAKIVGQFAGPEGDEFGLLLEKDSPLTPCVSQAVDALSESGELAAIEEEWLSAAADAPILE